MASHRVLDRGSVSELGAQRSPGLLEREREIATVLEALSLAAAGRGSVVLLEGPAGIGKSSLLAAACEHADQLGFTVLGARGLDSSATFRTP